MCSSDLWALHRKQGSAQHEADRGEAQVAEPLDRSVPVELSEPKHGSNRLPHSSAPLRSVRRTVMNTSAASMQLWLPHAFARLRSASSDRGWGYARTSLS